MQRGRVTCWLEMTGSRVDEHDCPRRVCEPGSGQTSQRTLETRSGTRENLSSIETRNDGETKIDEEDADEEVATEAEVSGLC